MDERTPDAPTGEPERRQREHESLDEPDTKYHQERYAEEAERDALAEELDSAPAARALRPD
jgi:hypothetical protein